MCIAQMGQDNKSPHPAPSNRLLYHATVAPSVECKSAVNVGDRRPNKQRHRLKLPLHFVVRGINKAVVLYVYFESIAG